jgi:peptidoglycan/xylan/chitin deacetylase (PgdA/CDA1 family)
MRTAVVRLLGPLLAGPGLRLLRLSRRRLGLVLVYHAVAVRGGDPGLELVPAHALGAFERQLRHLAARYRVVDASDILDAVAARRGGERYPVAITFDDDLASHAALALPALERRGLHATFFLCGASLDGPSEFWWERLQRVFADDATRAGSIHEEAAVLARAPAPVRAEVLSALGDGGGSADAGTSAADVRALVAAGMPIGFHTLRHELLTRLDDAGLAAAVREGRAELETAAGARLESIAYPHGDKDDRVLAAAADAGFTAGFSVAGRPVRADDVPLSIPRIVPTHRSLGHFALQLLSELLER